jgi:hypothetical protein
VLTGKMASCGYSLLLKNPGNCGISSDYPKQVVYVTLKECERDISDHLKFCKISADEAINNETNLLLARSGKINLLLTCLLSKYRVSYLLELC